jgi:hypothetical protein
MHRTNLALVFVAALTLPVPALANPIPVPTPANMPLEEMRVEIGAIGGHLHAQFSGDFTFEYIPSEIASMLFPVPSDAMNIRVEQDDLEILWTWSMETYPTILPEMSATPMIEWQGPFPTDGAVFTVEYEHDLIERPGEKVFFYAVGTGKYFPTYEKTTTAYFDIEFPSSYEVGGVWLDYQAHDYEVETMGEVSQLSITVESQFGPITNDLIVQLVPEPSTALLVGCGLAGLAFSRRRRQG